jgi:steroid delta-isomerase-like uncharacterized protein
VFGHTIEAASHREEDMVMSIVHDFAAAFNRGDVDAVLSCFTAEATYVDRFYGPYRGRAELRRMFERMFHEGRDYRWTMDVVVADGRRAAAEWTFGYVVGEAVPRSAGRPVRFRGMSVFELADGKIAGYREYFDTGVALLQLGFAPESLVKVLSRTLEREPATG